MVDIAQLVSASDCGSEGRGFESHYPPQKRNRGFCLGFFVSGVDNGIRKGGLNEVKAKNMPVACFLARGRIPVQMTASRKGCWHLYRMVATGHFKEYPLFSGMDLGFEEIVTPQIQLPDGRSVIGPTFF